MQVVLLDFEHGVNKEPDSDRRQDLEQINGNSHLSEQYLQLARDLDVMEAKTPEDVYKSHLVEGRAGDGPAIDSARQNLASTFVNAFVNAGFGQDKLVTATPESASEVRSQPSPEGPCGEAQRSLSSKSCHLSKRLRLLGISTRARA